MAPTSQRGEHAVGERGRSRPLDSLVVITDFGEPVLPGFRYLGAVERGGDKPYHVVINGENYHALEALRFTHAGKVDCIYIDPPYNSGARDWKYNNDYVDDDRCVPPQQVAGVHGAPPQARQGAAEPGRLGPHRHHRRERGYLGLGCCWSRRSPAPAEITSVTIDHKARGRAGQHLHDVDEYCFRRLRRASEGRQGLVAPSPMATGEKV